jgi:DNA repair protein RadD
MSFGSGLAEPKGAVCLRPYQSDAIARLDDRIAAGVRRVLLVAPCGAGKTTIAASIIRARVRGGERVLFLAHRRELIAQAYRRLLDLGLDEEQVGVIMASDPRRRPAAPVQVASVDTLRQRAKPPADVVFVDEAHRALARSYRDIAAAYPAAIHLGLTATPYRADGKGLGDAYDDLLVVASPRQLIDEGFLVEPRVMTVPPAALPDLSRVRVRGGDYDEGALSDAVNQRTLVGNIVEHWKRHAPGVRTVVFAVSIAHSIHLVERFREAGIAAEHLDGSTPAVERDAILARLESGATLVVSNCGVLCEGWDQPPVKCAVLARPTKSTGLYLQQSGRILRPWNDQRAIVLDHAGCAIDHGLPHEERAFSLEGEHAISDAERKKLRPRACPACFAVVARGVRVCPVCEEELGGPLAVPKEISDELVDATAAHPHQATWDALCEEARAKGYRAGWIFHRYRDRFGTSPPRHFKVPALDAKDDRSVVDTLRRVAREGGRLGWDLLDASRAGPPF